MELKTYEMTGKVYDLLSSGRMKMDEIKNCCNIDLDEISRLKELLSNSYDELEFNKKTEIKAL